MASPILVIGGTGTLGRQVVPRLRHAGYDVRVLSRPSHRGAERGNKVAEGIELVTGDLATGEGSRAAVAGTEIVLHLAGSAKATMSRRRTWSGRITGRGGPAHLRPVGTYEPLPSPGRSAPQGSGKRFGEDRQPCRHRTTDKGGTDERPSGHR